MYVILNNSRNNSYSRNHKGLAQLIKIVCTPHHILFWWSGFYSGVIIIRSHGGREL